ncbi:hypothetical protein ACQ4PT_034299 [Festuca glaucescens]
MAATTASQIGNAITIKLTRTNFLLWKAQVVPIVRGHQLFGYLDGTIPAPATTVTEGTGTEARQVPNPEYAAWYAQDQSVMGGLLSSVTPDVLPQVMRTTTAAELWTSLHNMLAAQNRGNSINIRFQLSNTKRNGSSAVEYYHKMIMLADTMANIGQPMAVEEVIGYILAGLGDEFKDLITILNNNREVTLTEFYSYLVSHDTRDELTSPAEFSSSANNVGRNTDSRNNQQRRPNNNANGQNGGYRGGERGGGRGRGRGNGPKCQVCGIFGHGALTCRNRFNHAYQQEEYHGGNSATTGHYNIDPNWYMDTGATDHLTSDLDRLSVHECYHGKDQVQVANGAGALCHLERRADAATPHLQHRAATSPPPAAGSVEPSTVDARKPFTFFPDLDASQTDANVRIPYLKASVLPLFSV